MHLSPELHYTALCALFTGLIWIPIIANRIVEMGAWPALRNPQPDVRPHADWAWRAAHAHRNAIENLVVFVPLALSVHLLQLGDALTAGAAAVFFVSRVAHAAIYTLGLPLVRTVAFLAGFVCQGILALRILGAL